MNRKAELQSRLSRIIPVTGCERCVQFVHNKGGTAITRPLQLYGCEGVFYIVGNFIPYDTKSSGDTHSRKKYDVAKVTVLGAAKVCFMEVCEIAGV